MNEKEKCFIYDYLQLDEYDIDISYHKDDKLLFSRIYAFNYYDFDNFYDFYISTVCKEAEMLHLDEKYALYIRGIDVNYEDNEIYISVNFKSLDILVLTCNDNKYIATLNSIFNNFNYIFKEGNTYKIRINHSIDISERLIVCARVPHHIKQLLDMGYIVTGDYKVIYDS